MCQREYLISSLTRSNLNFLLIRCSQTVSHKCFMVSGILLRAYVYYFSLAMPGGEVAGALPNSSADTSNVRGDLFALPPSPPLDIHDSNAAEKWKEFEQAWKNYSIATKLHQEPEAVQVATLLIAVGAEARNVFATFTHWASDTDQNKIQPVLQKFAA